MPLRQAYQLVRLRDDRGGYLGAALPHDEEEKMLELMKKIEAYGFQCEAGILVNCNEWKDLKRTAQEIKDGLAEVQETIDEVLKT